MIWVNMKIYINGAEIRMAYSYAKRGNIKNTRKQAVTALMICHFRTMAIMHCGCILSTKKT